MNLGLGCLLLQALLFELGNATRKTRNDSPNSMASPQASREHSLPEERPLQEYTPIVPGNKVFLDKLKVYMKSLYPKGELESLMHKTTLKSTDERPPLRAETLTIKWIPVECKTINLNLRKIRTIHQGKRNTVTKIYDKNYRNVYAWKTYENADEYSSELAFFMVADHPNIVKPVCFQRNLKSGFPGLVMEYIDGSSSMEYAKECGQDNLDAIVNISAQMLSVLEYMHWIGFVHADFKPENVLVDKNGNAVAVDFGFAINIPLYKHSRGTPCTMAPELLKIVDGPILENIDFWALGSTVGQWFGAIYMSNSRGRNKHPKRWVPVRIDRNEGYLFGELPLTFPQEVRQLMYHLMNLNPQMRMFNTQAQLEWLQGLKFWDGVDWDEI